MKVVYICSPYRSDPDGNSVKARKYSRFAVQQGYIPFAPHLLLPQYLNDNIPAERELALEMNKAFLTKCDELWVFGDVITEGMEMEITKAKEWKKPVRCFSEDLKEK